MELCIATAKIKGIDTPPSYWEHHCDYIWSITFEEPSTFVGNLAFIELGSNLKKALDYYYSFKDNFDKALICDGDKVSIIFDDSGHFTEILAIGCIGEDSWIDVRDQFSLKTFKELKIKVDSLKVY